ncbi:AraC family transcriptional regulator [Paenibacillus sp. 1011MAR3C5]|uniref:AraC family transcriptional regulator n=1 Tax=Paenibacillus sp. 1011MAR3C5 TaxID=1675787 RepID=UPI001601A830
MLAADQTLHEIAPSVGYKSSLYLSRKFKAVTGMTEGCYRRCLNRSISHYGILLQSKCWISGI